MHARVLTLATLAIIVLFALIIPHNGILAENELPKEVKVELIEGQYFVDGKPLCFIPHLPAQIPIKITDLDGLFEELGLYDDGDSNTPTQIRVNYEEFEESGKIYLEFRGKNAVIETLLIRIRTPISGTLAPSYADPYGPYYGAIAICVSVSWTPADQVLDVIIFDKATGQGYLYRLTSGSASTPCPSTRNWKEPIVLIGNPKPLNTKTITYSGTITRYYD
jgi:hypothetical protein